ncbi:uncharacterized protein hoka [Anabrus simplex]|uniref:uncharacterized protein hoka n=1 Tax=Anabrus simplex TaxID=316456 RepID=UPI0034DD1B27
MFVLRKTVYFTAIALVLLSCLLGEVEGRRKILRGRKTITRTYYRGNAIPAWSIVVIVAFCMIIVGGIIYGVMRKIVLGSSSNDYSPANTNDV